jgi:N-acetylneuraminic acid mutarotase
MFNQESIVLRSGLMMALGTVMTKSRWAGRVRLAAVATVGALTCGTLLPAFSGGAAAATASRLGPPNTWVGTGQMSSPRTGQTATLLPDGKVLVAGGGTAAADLYNPATRTFSPTGRMPVAVTDATATLLPDGKVLVAGGFHGNHQLANAELYDPASGTWSATGPMTKPRSGQTATLLRGGQVLVAGGGCNGSGYGCNAGSYEVAQRSAELYNPATGAWTRTGSMTYGRQFAVATVLKNGNVLVAGGFNNCDDDFCSDTRTAELYNPATGKWSRTGSMHAAREQFGATLLRGGQVLVEGGLNEGGFSGVQRTYSSAELYNPATGTWSLTAPMAVKRVGQTATLLRNGWVLVAGGGTSTAEIYEPQRAIWVSPGSMSTIRSHAAAALLPDGHVLVTGGNGPDGQPQTSAEEFLAGPGPLVAITPSTIAFGGQQVGTVSKAQSYQVSNAGSANLVVSGTAITGKNPGDFRVQTTCSAAPVPPGGTCSVRVRFAPTFTALRTATTAVSDNAPLSPQGPAATGYGAGPDSFVPVGSMSTPREHFTATLLKDGQVLVAGGQTETDAPLASAELYNPATRSFSATGSLNTARSYPAATLLRDGEVLITGGLDANSGATASAELYNPATGTWSNTTPTKATGYAETSTLLPDGDVLVTGFGGTNPAEVYNPAKATWTNTGPEPDSGAFSTATLLQNGQVLVTGATAALYKPATNAWTATGSPSTPRQEATTTLLPDGDVLLAGGDPPGGGNSLPNAELYDPTTGKWTVTGSMNAGRYGGTATLLTNGTVLATGGCTGGCGNQPALSSTEVYQPQQGLWFPITSMTQPRVFQTATLLPDGSVLVAGGARSYYGAATSTAELFTPVLLSVDPTSGPVGTQVTVSGSGFYAHEPISVFWDSQSVIGHTQANAAGAFSTKITVPKSSPAGANEIAVQGRRSFAGASATFTVTS